MNKLLLFPLLLFSFLTPGRADAQVTRERPLMTKNLPNVPSKEGLIETVVLSPGEVVPAHRHNANVFAYVLEGGSFLNFRGVNPRPFTPAKSFTNCPPMYTSGVAT